MGTWDGTEKRTTKRRKVQQAPFQEYPKMIAGQTVQSAAHEKALAKGARATVKAAKKPPKKAAKKPRTVKMARKAGRKK